MAIIGAPSSDARALDAKRLLDYGFAQYASADLIAAGTVVARVAVDDRPGRRVPYRGRGAAARPDPDRARRSSSPSPRRPRSTARSREGEALGTRHLPPERRTCSAAGGWSPTESAGAAGVWDHVRAGLGALIP